MTRSSHLQRPETDLSGVMSQNAVSSQCPSRRRLTRREFFDTQVVGASVHFRSAPQTPPLAKTLKPEDIVRPTMGVELSLHVLRSSRETVA